MGDEAQAVVDRQRDEARRTEEARQTLRDAEPGDATLRWAAEVETCAAEMIAEMKRLALRGRLEGRPLGLDVPCGPTSYRIEVYADGQIIWPGHYTKYSHSPSRPLSDYVVERNLSGADSADLSLVRPVFIDALARLIASR